MKIVVVASHSLGHIAPAIAFCQEIWQQDTQAQIKFITTEGVLERKLLDDSFNPRYYKREKIDIAHAYKLVALFRDAQELLKQFSPDLVIGFGGYLSIGFVFAAKRHKVPVFIHEQNRRLGAQIDFLCRLSIGCF